MTAANTEHTRNGKVRAVCEFCGRKSRPVSPLDGRLCSFDLPSGWSEAPYPPDHRHPDGSVGSMWACPDCERRLRRGEALRVHPDRGRAVIHLLATLLLAATVALPAADWTPDFGRADHRAHAAAGAVAAGATRLALEHTPWADNRAACIVLPILAAAAVGVGKEVADHHGLGTADESDAVATIAGGLAITLTWSF